MKNEIYGILTHLDYDSQNGLVPRQTEFYRMSGSCIIEVDNDSLSVPSRCSFDVSINSFSAWRYLGDHHWLSITHEYVDKEGIFLKIHDEKQMVSICCTNGKLLHSVCLQKWTIFEGQISGVFKEIVVLSSIRMQLPLDSMLLT